MSNKLSYVEIHPMINQPFMLMFQITFDPGPSNVTLNFQEIGIDGTAGNCNTDYVKIGIISQRCDNHINFSGQTHLVPISLNTYRELYRYMPRPHPMHNTLVENLCKMNFLSIFFCTALCFFSVDSQ